MSGIEIEHIITRTILKVMQPATKPTHNNSKESSNFCFGSKEEKNYNINDLLFPNENKILEDIILESDPVSAKKAQTTNTIKYIVDSGCTRHVVSTKENLCNFTPGNFGEITIADVKKLCSYGLGDENINTDSQHCVTLKNVLYCPDLQTSFLSVKKAKENNIKVIFKKARLSKTITRSRTKS